MLCSSVYMMALSYNKNVEHKARTALEVSKKQSLLMFENLRSRKGKFPKSIKDGAIELSNSSWWTSGFYPGTLWYLYEYTGDKDILSAAEFMTTQLEKEVYKKNDHDIGFKINCSYGNAYRVTHEEKYRDKIVDAGKSLASRFNPIIGCTKSWNGNKWEYSVIIDNMMNLELLTVSSALSGDRKYYDMAKSHADVTMKNHFRPDYSSYHVVDYDTLSGKPKLKTTHQGFSAESAWSRGQAWGLYGYTMMYRQTGDIRYLEQAINIGKFIADHPHLPKDKIPYWDFDCPKIPDTYRDASAGAVMASAFIELSTLVKDKKLADKFWKIGEMQIETLSSSRFLAKSGTNCNFILKHSVGFLAKNSEVDAPLSYADYYYVEAILRYLRVIEGKPVVDNTTFVSENTDRGTWISILDRITRPMLTACGNGTLHSKMPIESVDKIERRAECTHLEALGRVIVGIAPWLELGVDSTPEGRLREEYIRLVCKSIKNAVNPESPDYMNFNKGRQPLVDAAFLAHGLLRAPKQIWGNLDKITQERLLNELKSTRAIVPGQNNWLLFSAMIECAIFQFEGAASWDYSRVRYAIEKFEDWYVGDGMYGDGPEFHWDYYNSFVIQPMLTTVLETMQKAEERKVPFYEVQKKRYSRYAEILERLIAPDGTFPAIGRSIVYRFGAFQALSDVAYRKLLPKNISEGQVRSAMTKLMLRQMSSPDNFDENGWLKVGFSGSQLHLGETYISTGSLYLSCAAFVVLGLSPEDSFWTCEPEPWSSVKIWGGVDMKADKALK